MNQQLSRTLQEARTSLDPAAVLAAAKEFFSRRNTIYAAFVEKQGPTFVSFRGQGGEELIIGVAPVEGGTRVTGSTYMFDQQIARFFSTLLPLAEAPPTIAVPVAGASTAGAAA